MGRFRRNGTLDRSYGHLGRARVGFRAGWDGNTYAVAMDVAPDGLVTVVGATRFNTLWAARFRPDGQPDDEFGDAGVAQVSEDAYVYPLHGVLVDGHGAATVGFVNSGGARNDGAVELLRLNTAGALDPSFGDGGLAVSPPGEAFFDAVLVRLGSGTGAFGTKRVYNTTGSFDALVATADADGHHTAVAPLRTSFEPVAGASRGNGALVLGRDPSSDELLAVTASGGLDPTFGRDGLATRIARHNVQFADVAVDADGRALLAGSQYGMQRPGSGMAVERVTAGGAPDTAFGARGLTIIKPRGPAPPDQQGPAYASAEAVVYDPATARILVGGSYGDGQSDAREDYGGDAVEVAALRTGRSLATIRARGRITARALRVSIRCRASSACGLHVLGGRRAVRLRLSRGGRRAVAVPITTATARRLRRGGALTVTVLAQAGARRDGIAAAVRG